MSENPRIAKVTMPTNEERPTRGDWTLPEWMEPYRDLIESDLGGNSIEELVRDEKTNGFNNVIRASLIVMGETKVRMLTALRDRGLLSEVSDD